MRKERVITKYMEEHLNFLLEMYKSFDYMSKQDNLRCDYFSKQAKEYYNLYLECTKLIYQEQKYIDSQNNNIFGLFN